MIFSEFQDGFRQDYRTTDHIFAVKTIINKYIFSIVSLTFQKHLILWLGNLFSASC